MIAVSSRRSILAKELPQERSQSKERMISQSKVDSPEASKGETFVKKRPVTSKPLVYSIFPPLLFLTVNFSIYLTLLIRWANSVYPKTLIPPEDLVKKVCGGLDTWFLTLLLILRFWFVTTNFFVIRRTKNSFTLTLTIQLATITTDLLMIVVVFNFLFRGCNQSMVPLIVIWLQVGLQILWFAYMYYWFAHLNQILNSIRNPSATSTFTKKGQELHNVKTENTQSNGSKRVVRPMPTSTPIQMPKEYERNE
ncbi:unnamed protein product, partial [Mesorhabditis belari]|uniref:Uncharacterized protein n=1 Tax=Mesorhabditis belari TaxID=2138241 RepID=A0AAF3FDU0_9BILA